VGDLEVVAPQLLRHSLPQGHRSDFARQDDCDLLIADGVPGLDEELRDF